MADQDSIARVRELAWATGLFEGEGCITHNGTARQLPKLVLCTTDEDVIRRFWLAVGNVGHLSLRKTSAFKGGRPHYKDCWEWRVTGHRHVRRILGMLWFGLGSRRRARALEMGCWPSILAEYDLVSFLEVTDQDTLPQRASID